MGKMDEALKSEIAYLQNQFLKAIKCHKVCFEKVKNGDDEANFKGEVENIQKMIRECQERQSNVLQQIASKNGNAVFKFKLYEIPTSAPQGKKRRRKDLSLPIKSEKKNVSPPVVPKSRTPSPVKEETSGSDVSESDSSDDELDTYYASQSSMPVPLPQARPKSLTNGKEAFSSISRHNLSHKYVKKNKTPLKVSDEELCRDIPVYEDPPPSPEPVDEKEAKIRFMAALGLIPKEAESEILSRKTERKRRSTAHPNFVYNDDWEVPQKKRARQYLSPVKSKVAANVEKVGKAEKIKVETKSESKKSSQGIEGVNGDSSQRGKSPSCKTCGAPGPLLDCQDCGSIFHAKCSSVPLELQSFLLCSRCYRAKRDDDKCSISKEDSPSNLEGQKLRDKLAMVLWSRMKEKSELEKKVLSLAESLAIQSKLKNDLIEESKELIEKIDTLRKFVISYQMVDGKPRPGVSKSPNEDSSSCNTNSQSESKEESCETGEDLQTVLEVNKPGSLVNVTETFDFSTKVSNPNFKLILPEPEKAVADLDKDGQSIEMAA